MWVCSNCVPCWEGRRRAEEASPSVPLSHTQWGVADSFIWEGGCIFHGRNLVPTGASVEVTPGVNRNWQYFELGIGTGAVEFIFFFNINWSGPLSQSRCTIYVVKQKILWQGSYLISVRFTNEFCVVELILVSGAFKRNRNTGVLNTKCNFCHFCSLPVIWM